MSGRENKCGLLVEIGDLRINNGVGLSLLDMSTEMSKRRWIVLLEKTLEKLEMGFMSATLLKLSAASRVSEALFDHVP